ncbi:unnamed protein product [[Candida] boidinii]|nr:unnamed protein product [[Candida] boidinii]
MELHDFHLDSSPIHNKITTSINNFESNSVSSTVDSEMTLFSNETLNKKNSVKFDVHEEVPFSKSLQNNNNEPGNNNNTNNNNSKYVVKKGNDDDDDDDNIIL